MGRIPEGQKVCAVCAGYLDTWTEADGSTIWWHSGAEHAAEAVTGERHPYQAGDHVPVPVDEGEVAARPVCDFCGADGPRWIVTAAAFDVRLGDRASGGAVTKRFSPWWAACQTCADLICDDRWDDLLTRTADPDGEPQLWALNRELFARVRDTCESISPIDDVWRPLLAQAARHHQEHGSIEEILARRQRSGD